MVRLARDLVHIYQHMEADRGYAEAKSRKMNPCFCHF
jgi:hypothetical protein